MVTDSRNVIICKLVNDIQQKHNTNINLELLTNVDYNTILLFFDKCYLRRTVKSYVDNYDINLYEKIKLDIENILNIIYNGV
jgi:hypothetical protein